MARISLPFIFLIAGASIALAAGWSYDLNAADGPNSWGGSCGSGSKQSPIDINTTTAMYDSSLGDFTLVNYGTTPAGVNFTAKNSGKSLKVSMDSHIYNVSGGGLPGVYTTVQFHLHWGSNNNKGSEHTMNGMMYPAEIHFVSMNIKYSNLSESLGYSDGLAVLGVFLKLGSSNNSHYNLFVDHITSVRNKDESVIFPAFPLLNLLPTDKTKYYRYNGSLTTPTCNEAVTWTVFNDPVEVSQAQTKYYLYNGSLITPDCNEAVTWTVFNDPVEVSQAQLDALRSLKMNSTMNIVDNYRPVQNLGSRKVKSSFSSSQAPPTTTAVPVPTEAASVALKISNVLLMLVLFLGEVFFH